MALRCLGSFLLLLLHQQPGLLVAAAQTNLTAGDALTPPGYITSPSGVFAFGFRALDSDPAKFILATWFHFNDHQPQSVVWFAKQPVSGPTYVTTAQSALSVTADGQLALADTTNAGNRVLWRAPTPNLKRGSVLVLLDTGNLQFLDGGGKVLWESFQYPTDTLLPGQSLAMDPDRSAGKLFAKRADTEFTTGRFSMGIQKDGNVVLYVDLLSGNSPDNAYWQAYTNSPDGNTTVIFDEQGRLNYTLHNGTVQSLITPAATTTVDNYYNFARMDPDGIVRIYVRPKNAPDGAGNTSWSVSGAFPSDGCNKWTSGLQGMCGPGSYIIVTVCVAFLLLATIGGFVAQRHLTRKRESQRLSSVRAFTKKELYKATNGFRKLLGKGSFGEVYEGQLQSPRPHVIAVKRLISSHEYSEQEFTNEVQSIGQIHHRNLVRMIGYCKEGKHRMLVFEFMPGGSLRGFLFRPEAERPPPWSWRADAALGIARGIEYLHNGCSSPIIHCDIKPDNILLDGRCDPKITDFGISKLLGNQQVHTTVTNIRGTRGYIAPEWLRSEARVDTKADVYSFGVVLLEMICCRKCQEPLSDQSMDDETVTLFGWAGELVSTRRTELMLHRDDDDAAADLERVEWFARVAFWCIEPNPALRPTMHQVVQMLESVADAKALSDPPIVTWTRAL